MRRGGDGIRRCCVWIFADRFLSSRGVASHLVFLIDSNIPSLFLFFQPFLCCDLYRQVLLSLSLFFVTHSHTGMPIYTIYARQVDASRLGRVINQGTQNPSWIFLFIDVQHTREDCDCPPKGNPFEFFIIYFILE